MFSVLISQAKGMGEEQKQALQKVIATGDKLADAICKTGGEDE